MGGDENIKKLTIAIQKMLDGNPAILLGSGGSIPYDLPSIQQWIPKENIHPLALFCDEAHLYLPSNTNSSVEAAGLENFERIAKEGRKYGMIFGIFSRQGTKPHGN